MFLDSNVGSQFSSPRAQGEFKSIDADKLRQLSDEVSRIAGSIAKLSVGFADSKTAIGVHADPHKTEVDEEAVRWLINARNVRRRFIPSDLFADPAWDMLLELYRAQIAQQPIAVSSLCIAANVPATTALRYIKTMVRQGMIVREPDPCDARRVHVELAPHISEALRGYFAKVVLKPLLRKGASRRGSSSSASII